jgi:hypothetical protein
MSGKAKSKLDRPATTVVNVRKSKYDVYIGRPSKWGNPYRRGTDGTKREVIEKYRAYARKFSKADLAELKGKRLGCFCHPLACHGDVLAELADRE